jgi:repressor LexA
VEGDSMRDAGMRTGDILMVRRQPNVREGDIVVAAIPDEVTGEPRATVKRLPRSGRIRLLPENPAYEPIENDEITITGKVMGLWRTPYLTVASRPLRPSRLIPRVERADSICSSITVLPR